MTQPMPFESAELHAWLARPLFQTPEQVAADQLAALLSSQRYKNWVASRLLPAKSAGRGCRNKPRRQVSKHGLRFGHQARGICKSGQQ